MTANETKRVSDREFDEAYREMCENFGKMTDGKYDGYRTIQFHFDYNHDAPSDEKPWNRPKVMQVNWAAIGTVMPSETAQFASALAIAAGLAAGFKYNGYKVYYED